MTAAKTVFGTYELLEHILVQLEPKHIPVASQVCRAWRELARRSKPVRYARCLHPRYFFATKKSWSQLTSTYKAYILSLQAPFYMYAEPIRFHKALERYKYCDELTTKRTNMSSLLRLSTPQKIHMSRQFITDPPVSHILVQLNSTRIGMLGRPTCTLRNEEGITVGELLDAVSALEASSTLPKLSFFAELENLLEEPVVLLWLRIWDGQSSDGHITKWYE